MGPITFLPLRHAGWTSLYARDLAFHKLSDIPCHRKTLQRGVFSNYAVYASKDHYQTLGVRPSASRQDIKQAFRSLARKHHPDVNKSSGAEKHFKDLKDAYEVLSDESRRLQYDRGLQVAEAWRKSETRKAAAQARNPGHWPHFHQRKPYAQYGAGGAGSVRGGNSYAGRHGRSTSAQNNGQSSSSYSSPSSSSGSSTSYDRHHNSNGWNFDREDKGRRHTSRASAFVDYDAEFSQRKWTASTQQEEFRRKRRSRNLGNFQEGDDPAWSSPQQPFTTSASASSSRQYTSREARQFREGFRGPDPVEGGENGGGSAWVYEEEVHVPDSSWTFSFASVVEQLFPRDKFSWPERPSLDVGSDILLLWLTTVLWNTHGPQGALAALCFALVAYTGTALGFKVAGMAAWVVGGHCGLGVALSLHLLLRASGNVFSRLAAAGTCALCLASWLHSPAAAILVALKNAPRG